MSADMRDAGDLARLARDALPLPAWIAGAERTAVPPHAHTLADAPTGHARAERVQQADHLVSGYDGIGDPGKPTSVEKESLWETPQV
jgi:hypothetical protein